MAGESGRGCKGIVYHYYKCSGAKRKLGCKKKAIRKNWIEDVVVKYTVTQVLTDTVISRIADAIVIMQEQEDTVTPVLKLQRDSLRGSIAQLQLERRKFTKEEIVDWVSRYKDGNIKDPDYRREIIDSFVNSVFVYDDKLILTYNYKDGGLTLTLQEIEAALSSDLTGMCRPRPSSPPATFRIQPVWLNGIIHQRVRRGGYYVARHVVHTTCFGEWNHPRHVIPRERKRVEGSSQVARFTLRRLLLQLE